MHTSLKGCVRLGRAHNQVMTWHRAGREYSITKVWNSMS